MPQPDRQDSGDTDGPLFEIARFALVDRIPGAGGLSILDGARNVALENEYRRERAREVERQHREAIFRDGIERLRRDYFGGLR